MANARRWEDVKAEAHQLHPELADPALRASARAELEAHIVGYHLRDLRKSLGRTQAEVASALGVSQSRISQIENGDIDAMELETVRAYATALGGVIDVRISVGSRSVKVA